MKPFLLQIVTPDERVYEKNVMMVTMGTATGEIGVLSGHKNLVTRLEPDVLHIYEQGITKSNITQNFFISGGFAEITGDRTIILADEALVVEQMDPAYLAHHIKELNEALHNVANERERDVILRKLHVKKAKMIAVKEVTTSETSH